jgi:hypothetical protein
MIDSPVNLTSKNPLPMEQVMMEPTKMLRKLRLLLLASFFLAEVNGDPCNLCGAGASISLPDKPLTISGFEFIDKCSTMDALLPTLLSDGSPECDMLQSIGSLCGCPIIEGACHLCSDGTPVSFPDAELSIFSDMVGGLTIPTCEIVESYLHSYNSTDSLCGASQTFLSKYCGCGQARAAEPMDMCSLCRLGGHVSKPEKLVNIEGLPFRSCQDLEDAALLLLPVSTGECSIFQEAFGALCGCELVQQRPCNICRNTDQVPNPNATVDLLSHIFFDLAPTCEVIESLALSVDAYSEECFLMQSLGTWSCGCEKTENHCQWCRGQEGIPKEYYSNQFANLESGIWDSSGLGGRVLTCGVADQMQFLIPKDAYRCWEVQQLSWKCGCNDFLWGYLGANTPPKQAVFAWLPRLSGLISFIGSLLVVRDTIFHKERRKKMYNQLVVGMSVFDLLSSLNFMVSTAAQSGDDPYFTEGFGAYGTAGTPATCRVQGFLVQFSLTTIFYNFLLSVYFHLAIVNEWRERRFTTRIRIGVHTVTILFGLALAFVGLPYYERIVTFCYFTFWPYEENWAIKTFLAIVPLVSVFVAATLIIIRIYLKGKTLHSLIVEGEPAH